MEPTQIINDDDSSNYNSSSEDFEEETNFVNLVRRRSSAFLIELFKTKSENSPHRNGNLPQRRNSISATPDLRKLARRRKSIPAYLGIVNIILKILSKKELSQ